jgi:hypothetical protein
MWGRFAIRHSLILSHAECDGRWRDDNKNENNWQLIIDN